MLKIQRTSWRKCSIFVDDIKSKNARNVIAVEAMNKGIPRAISRHIAKKALSRTERGIRMYLVTCTIYFFVNYEDGLIVIGTEDDMIRHLHGKYCGTQLCLWLNMAERAAVGKKMSYREIRDYILEGPADDPEIMTKNVAPPDRLAPKCRQKRRKRGRVKAPKAVLLNETQQESFRKEPLRIVRDINNDGKAETTQSKGVA